MTIQIPTDSDLKARHAAMWALGDYPHMVETFLLPLGPRLVDATGIGPGTRVLDVAAGTGNASIPAAQRGADVTASDLTPELLEAGRQRAEAEGLELDWVVADAENLPFDDASYDVVMSSIGVMFAPHHQAAADELVRVCRPGGTFGLTVAGTVEMSNVDLATEFTNMISAQRGFQANSRVISTADEMLQDLVNLKR